MNEEGETDEAVVYYGPLLEQFIEVCHTWPLPEDDDYADIFLTSEELDKKYP